MFAFRVLVALSLVFGAATAQIPTHVTYKAAFGTDGENKFKWPVDMREMPGAPGVFVVAEKNSGDGRTGKLWLLKPGAGGAYVKSEFLSIQVASGTPSNVETGLLSVAFHPEFQENRRYFIDYNALPTAATNNREMHTVEERLANESLTADAGQGKIILSMKAGGHNGGSIGFGLDGYLYVSTGDGIDIYQPSQRRSSVGGKILRIDVDKPSDGKNYGIPADNPFQEAGMAREIFALGFRNPWKFNFDPAGGALWVADVGQYDWEEVNLVTRGGNYGWPAYEGNHGTGTCTTGVCIAPKTEYGHTAGRCITGGQIYRGDPTSKFYGVYVFADNAYDGPMFAFAVDGAMGSHVSLTKIGTGISGIAMDSRSNLYALGHDNGLIYRLEHPELREGAVATRARPQSRVPRAGYDLAPDADLHGVDGSRTKARGAQGIYFVRTPQGIRPVFLRPDR